MPCLLCQSDQLIEVEGNMIVGKELGRYVSVHARTLLHLLATRV